ncbi:hypothetical protein [Streptomyces microflavus]|uniref:hypothetical protein n=2 Tax=Streptomyces microflavus TaxID=1919 RepID=UPI003B227BD8
MGRLPPALRANLPAADIAAAHRSPLFISTLTTGTALAMGTLMGPDGADALMAGILDQPTIPGIVSLGWWAAVTLVPFKLRKVLHRGHPRTTAPTPTVASHPALATEADLIAQAWGHHISHPKTGTHRGQVLTVTTVTPTRWAASSPPPPAPRSP